ncbi:MAG: polysaccharide deacetylase family protein [Acidobacteriaceae bacterium]|nr:polysaccharide deacetylase family protein [Acidobacteriaceae bacterium]
MDPLERDYIARWASTILGFPCIDYLSEETASTIFHELSRSEETLNPIRDTWGNWDWQYCASQRKGLTYVPHVDQLLRSALSRRVRGSNATMWPANKKFALVLTHDVDMVSESAISLCGLRQCAACELVKPNSLLRKSLSLSRMSARYMSQAFRDRLDDCLWHYEDWLKVEESYGFRSTFYFFPSPVKKPAQWDCIYQFPDIVRFNGKRMTVREMMQSIHRAGWEIGVHGSYRSAFDGEVMKREKGCIEDALGSRVTSVRQHYLHYDVRITPTLQGEAGLTTDSTQGFNRSIGFRAGTSFPYWCWDHVHQNPLRVLEIPLHIMDGSLFHPAALEYDEEFAVRHALQLMDAVEAVGGCLTLLWHAEYLNRPKYRNSYKRLLDEAAQRGAWGCGAGELYEWWLNRETSVAMDHLRTASTASPSL